MGIAWLLKALWTSLAKLLSTQRLPCAQCTQPSFSLLQTPSNPEAALETLFVSSPPGLAQSTHTGAGS